MNYEGTSNLSKDDAWYNASKKAFDDQLITEIEWEYSYIEYMQQFSNTQVTEDEELNTYSINSIDQTYIRGTINIDYISTNDDDDGDTITKKKPLKYAVFTCNLHS